MKHTAVKELELPTTAAQEQTFSPQVSDQAKPSDSTFSVEEARRELRKLVDVLDEEEPL